MITLVIDRRDLTLTSKVDDGTVVHVTEHTMTELASIGSMFMPMCGPVTAGDTATFVMPLAMLAFMLAGEM